jgi:hypothetical protein
MSHASLTRQRKTTTVEVEVDIDDLIENGWHHEEDCPSTRSAIAQEREALASAVRSLHRQAHPSQHPDPFMCREEPCRSLPADCIFTSISSR